MPAGYSLNPGIVVTADSTSLEELADDPITTKLEQQEAAKESRARRDVRDAGYNDGKSSAGGGSDVRNNPDCRFSFSECLWSKQLA